MMRMVVGRDDDGWWLVWQAGRRRGVGRPEVDFVELWAAAEQDEPLAIGYADKGFHLVLTPNWLDRTIADGAGDVDK